jgi:anti-sigma regulatory factor (Ser/Thr protein kinase)/GNAT superfamily N-acetyltransferase
MKTNKTLGHLRMPNDEHLVPALLSYAAEISKIAGFASRDSYKIQLAVEEACLNLMKTSFLPGEEGVYDVEFIQRLDGIEIHIHDMGLPYDPALMPDYDPKADLLEQDMEGLGSFLISETMDEYRFNNLGIKGKEVVLIKYFDTPRIAAEQEEPREAEVVKPPAQKKPVEQIPFEIRQMQPEEALEVCRCIYDCYGYSYANENVYFPERLAAMNQESKLLSSVALTPEGEIGGHFAIIFHEKLPAELGIAVTKKKFRGQGFAREMAVFLEEYAIAAGHKGMQVKKVTAHPYTQKFCIKLGYQDCGLLLGHSPKSLSFKGIADTLKQRNSDVLGFKYFVDPDPRKLYTPDQHREMIIRLYKNIGVDAETISSNITEAKKEHGVVEVKVHTLRSLAELLIFEIGNDTIPVLRHEMRKLFIDDIQVFELYLSLNDPMTPLIVPELEQMGYIFTSILPETNMGDALIMQYFNGVYVDYDQVVLVSELAQELLAYIKNNDPRAKG